MAKCEMECWYLYPHRLTNREGYRCHCPPECPAHCGNCKVNCNERKIYGWCHKFQMKDAPTEQ